ncbi:MAG TPA: glycosyltransferase family 4 protein [Gemmatimonadales bacterium]|nr:glycosyltransferase family 4 protein [Gemmatimonadales bacterium]
MSASRGILLFGNHPPPFGGVPTHLHYLSSYLADRGWRVHVLSMAGARRRPETQNYTVHRPRSRELHLALARTVLTRPRIRAAQGWRSRLATDSPRLLLGCMALSAFARNLVQQYDLQVIGAYHLMAAGLAGAWVADELGLPLVTTVFGEIYADPDRYRRQRVAVEYVLGHSRRVLSPSRHCAASLQLLDLPPAEVLYYGIDTSVFRPDLDGSGVRTRLGLATDDFVVLFVARMVREMGLHVLLASIHEVIAEAPNVRFIIAGTSGELENDAQASARQYPGRVFVFANVGPQELPLLYAAASIAVTPSINERACLGLAVAEAMASGKPVVVSRVGGGPELLTDGESGLLVPPNDSAALARAVLHLVRQPERLERMGQRGRERATLDFDARVTSRRMEEIFLEALQ